MQRAQGKEERQRLSQGGVSTSLKILSQIHSGVHRRNLVGITIERQRRSFEELAETPLAGLAPSRMIHSGVDVCIEAVFIWRLLHPGRYRLFVDAELVEIVVGRHVLIRRLFFVRIVRTSLCLCPGTR